jgi:preprotein translocase subunit SecD
MRNIKSVVMLVSALALFGHAAEPAIEFRLVVDAQAKGAVKMESQGSALFVSPQALPLTPADVASSSVDHSTGMNPIHLKFTADGSKRFAEITKRHVGSRLAIIIRGRLLAAPTLHEPILDGVAVIHGAFNVIEAAEIVEDINQASGKK